MTDCIINNSSCFVLLWVELSCRGRCFESFARGRECDCDSDCKKYGKCCSDYDNFCEEGKHPSTARSVLLFWLHWQCLTHRPPQVLLLLTYTLFRINFVSPRWIREGMLLLKHSLAQPGSRRARQHRLGNREDRGQVYIFFSYRYGSFQVKLTVTGSSDDFLSYSMVLILKSTVLWAICTFAFSVFWSIFKDRINPFSFSEGVNLWVSLKHYIYRQTCQEVNCPLYFPSHLYRPLHSPYLNAVCPCVKESITRDRSILKSTSLVMGPEGVLWECNKSLHIKKKKKRFKKMDSFLLPNGFQIMDSFLLPNICS